MNTYELMELSIKFEKRGCDRANREALLEFRSGYHTQDLRGAKCEYYLSPPALVKSFSSRRWPFHLSDLEELSFII